MKVAVIGHVEWCRFSRVDRIPLSGEIVRATDTWDEAAGGGSVAAVQLARLADGCLFFTAVGDDENGRKAVKQLQELGVEVHASVSKNAPTKEAFVYIDNDNERTITVMGSLKPSGKDSELPWEKLADMDAVFFASGDSTALEAARQSKCLVATSRVLPVLQQASTKLDALVMSSKDGDELYASGDLTPEPSLVVKTEGKEGGVTISGERYQAVVINENEIKDYYGCGDSFAAGLTYGLAKELTVADALKQAARAGAEAAQRNGAHGLKV